MSYTLSLISDNNTLWKISDIKSEELLEGLIVTYFSIIGGANKLNYHPQLKLQWDGSIIIDDELDVIFSTAKLSQYPLEMVTKTISIDTLGNSHKYGIWLEELSKNTYAFFVFETPEFIQGILTMCNAFQIPSNRIITSLPIKDEIEYHIF
jgi:hypothetical protein